MTDVLSDPVLDEEADDRQRDRLRQKARTFIRMRWLAAGAGALFIWASTLQLSLLPEASVAPLTVMILGLLLFNLFCSGLVRTAFIPFRQQLFVQILGDLFFLTGLLHFSGGVENPFLPLYFVHIILSSQLIGVRKTYLFTLLTTLMVTGMGLSEYGGYLDHYHLRMPADAATLEPAKQPYYVVGVLSGFHLVAWMIAYFSCQLTHEIRQRKQEAVRSERHVRRERNKFRKLVEASGAGFMLFDRDLNLIWYNDRAGEWFGEENLTLNNPCPFLQNGLCQPDVKNIEECPVHGCEQGTPSLSCLAEDVLRGREQQTREATVQTADGSQKYFQFITYPIRDQDGDIEQVAELIHDVTKRKRLEQEMQHEERMATMGRIASGVAHEIGNPLSSLSARLRRLREKSDESFVKETTEFLEEQVSRMNQLVRDISSFARAPESRWEPCDLNDMIQETVNLLAMDPNSKNVEITIEVPDDFPTFVGSRDQLSQVFMNLGMNALEAMEDGGRLTISARREDDDVLIQFTDTGEGIPPEQQNKIFTPYFTTRDRDEGTGLGLSVSHSLVEAHGGSIHVESQPGEGSTFTVQLPFHEPGEDEQPDTATQQSTEPMTTNKTSHET